MQVGGFHYGSDKSIDVFAFADAHDLDSREFSVVKYITRHRRKDLAKDVCKAIDCAIRVLQDIYDIDINDETTVSELLRSYENSGIAVINK